ncbi:lytic transglycosylase domain-containing protein [Tepidibacter formicigenes]|uniref:Soluble lytic murein transglycosylase n=1 Tax=Tepidibacter formicigenes DSM 15518 TaxID=1123349 RepID=A0A1M6K573_9FIRM|nr:lytic transglycosylase domain-containing protein [Tepidibacter formicigenes]SHJ54042.1 soluble lytic murein transglycosylase [Tepidibacter formicigenes DSM 15518]
MNRKSSFIVCIITVCLIIGGVLNIKNFLQIIYPTHYEEYVYEYSKEYNIDPYLVFAIIKTESKFFPYAKSSKEAKGLMQISEGTQKWAMEDLNIENSNIFDPQVNIKIGCWYINKLFEQFEDIDLVIAAYNGGSGNVDKWLKDDRYSYNGINLTNIPFKETKNYVNKVKKYHKIYKILYEKRGETNEKIKNYFSFNYYHFSFWM